MNEHELIRAEIELQAIERNHGAIHRSEALSAGMTSAQIDRRLRRKQWMRLGPQGWYVVAERATDPLAALTAGTMALDGPAWGASALALIDLGRHPAPPVVASDRRYDGPGVVRVQVSCLSQLPRTRVHGISTVTPAVAVVAAGRWHGSDTELHLLVDEAIRNGVTTWPEVERVLKFFPRRGRAGSTRMRQVLDSHHVDPALPLSPWGRRFVVGLEDAGLPRPQMEYRVCDESDRFIAQVDAAYPAYRYAIELDSKTFHLNTEAFETDRERDGNLAQLGWLVRRFTWHQWQDRRSWVIRTIRADLASQSRQLLPHLHTVSHQGLAG